MFVYYRKERYRGHLLEEYEDAKQVIESLKNLKKSIMHDYYTRRISEKEARRRIFDCEKQLVFERGTLRNIMRKLGMEHDKASGDEEIIEWITEKLRAGEDPEVLKKGLSDLGMNPILVDKVRKVFRK